MSRLHARGLRTPSAHRRRHRTIASAVNRVPLLIEQMERRTLMSVTTVGIPSWIEQGPSSTTDGQVFTLGNNNVSGAVEALAPHPSNANILFAGAVASGIWRTTNATAGSPTWVPLTDQFASLSIGDLAYSPLDATNSTLYAGTGRGFISGGPDGNAIGLLRTTDGGNSWALIGASQLTGVSVRSVVPTNIGTSVADQVVLIGTLGSGVMRSTNGGQTFTTISGSSGSTDGLDNDADGSIDEAGERNLPAGGNAFIAPDPGNTNRFYAAIAGTGIFRSDNGGANWVQVNTGLTGTAAATRIELSVSAAAGNPVYAAFIAGNSLANVFRSTDQGGNWAAVGTAPAVTASGQGRIHFSLLADNADPTLVYVGGDTFTSGPFFGNLARGDSDGGGSWTAISRSVNTLFTAPHADSRMMAYDANGDIIEADDGGVFRLDDPSGLVSTWSNVNGNLGLAEMYAASYDHVSDVIFGGTQDTGTVEGSVGAGPHAFGSVNQADGNWSSVGYTQILGVDVGIRYTMSNNFGSFQRRLFGPGNFPLGSSGLALNGMNAFDVANNFSGFSVFPFEANRFDGTRIVIGANGLYESTDSGDNLTTLNAGGNTNVSAIAYGGMLGGVPNEDVLYVSVGGQLFLRTTSGGTLNQLTNYPGNNPIDIAMDPDNWQRVYVTDGSNVFRSVDSGATWTRIDNAGTLGGALQTVEVFGGSTAPDDEIVLVGGTLGLFRSMNPGAGVNALWSEVGLNLPNAPVIDVHYDALDDRLIVGTHGRGAWTISNAADALTKIGVIQIDGDTDFAGQDDVIRLIRSAANPLMLDIFLNSVSPVLSVPLTAINQINVRGLAGNDTLIADSSNGLLSFSNNIRYDGGSGFDTLRLQQTGGATNTNDTYSVGPAPGDGISTITGPSGTQQISFENLSPVIDTVPSAFLTVTATAEANAISYTAGAAGRGKVAIDNYEPIEFTNKSQLTIDASTGNDVVNLNHLATPTSLTLIRVVAGDGDDHVTTHLGTPVSVRFEGGAGHDFLDGSGASGGADIVGGEGNDTLIGSEGDDVLMGNSGQDVLIPAGGVNGVDGGSGADTFVVQGTDDPDTIVTEHIAGDLAVTNGASSSDNFIDNLEIVRIEAGAGSDDITIKPRATGGLSYTVLGGDPIGLIGDRLNIDTGGASAEFTPGPESDAGGIRVSTVSPTDISFDEIEALSITGGPAIISGTNGPDAITVIARDASTHAGANGVQDFTVSVNASPTFLFLNTPSLTVNALGGSDEIVVRAPAPNGADWNVQVAIDGGPPSASDKLIVETPGGGAEQVEYIADGSDSGTLTLLGAAPSSIDIAGIEHLVYDGEGDGDSLRVFGTTGDDTITHTPGAGNDEGEFRVNALLGIAYQNLGAAGALNVDALGGPDTFRYVGTSLNDQFSVNAAGDVNLNARLKVGIASVDTLTLEGSLGDDTFTLVPAVQSSPYSVINFTGGESSAGDVANLVGTDLADDFTVSGTSLSAGGKTINMVGVERETLNAKAGTDTLRYVGVGGQTEAINVASSPTAGTGTMSVAGLMSLSFTSGELINVDGNAADNDTLSFLGTNDLDNVQIHADAVGTPAAPVMLMQNTASATLLTLVNYTGIQVLKVFTLDGADVINVYTGPAIGRNVFIDGGIPTAKKKLTDKLNVFYVFPKPHIVHSAATQLQRTGLVDLDYGTSRTLVQYEDTEDIVIAKQ